MQRVVIMATAVYGLVLSGRATQNIRRTRRLADAGDRAAQQHFILTRYAHVFGVRNSDLGLVFYGLLAAATASGLIARRGVYRTLLLGSAGSVVLSVYLLWALMFRLRVRCVICLQSHATNGLLLLMLLRWRHANQFTSR